MYNPNDIIQVGNKLIYPENKIDLFDVYDGNYDTSIIRFNNIPPYKEVSKLIIDIETTTDLKNVKDGVVYMIGLRNEKGKNIILTNKDEKQLLLDFLGVITKKKPSIILGYNIFEFDLPYLEYRFVMNDLYFPFNKSYEQKVHRTAMKFSKPTIFHPYFADSSIGRGSIIDMYHQTLALDFTIRKLTSYRLKSVVLELGLRKEPRLDIPYSVMMQHYNKWMNDGGSLDEMTTYLIHDLEDTELITDRILPSIYYQSKYLDWNLQSIAYGGNGSKWNSILSRYYGESPQPDDKLQIDGGYTFAIPGLYGNVQKNLKVYQLDFTSLYPSIMLANKVYSHEKDPDMVILCYLDYLKMNRVNLKRLYKQTGDLNAYYEQESAKPYINSAYGLMGTLGIPFNDFKCAAFITAYGRKICKYVQNAINNNKGFVIQADTDGLIFSVNADESQQLIDIVTNSLPKTFAMELDFTADSVYIPSDSEGVGLKKNYIIFNGGKIEKMRGIWNKRNIPKLEKEFPTTYLTKLIYEGLEAAEKYQDSKLNEINNLQMSLDDITVTRIVGKKEKTLQELGLVYETPEGLRTTYYIGHGVKVYKRAPKNLRGDEANKKYTEVQTPEGKRFLVDVPEKVNKGDYHSQYYIDKIIDIVNSISESINIGLIHQTQNNNV